MTNTLSAEQRLLRDTARDFWSVKTPRSRLRELIDSREEFPRAWFQLSGEIGMFSVLSSPEGVSGAPMADLALLTVEAGRSLAPVPLAGTNVVVDAMARCAPQEWHDVVDALSSGEALGAWCCDAEALLLGRAGRLRADPAPGGVTISGSVVVEGRADVDWLLITAQGTHGPMQCVVAAKTPGVALAPVVTVDVTRPYVQVSFDNVAVSEGALPDADGQIQRQLDIALLMQVAELTGIMDAVFEMTMTWLRDRRSFGRQLASYQELKHRCADMRMWLEAALACTEGLAQAMDACWPGATRLASAAKAYVAQNGVELVQDCIQMHGGIGLTWEHDLHLYLRRATAHWGACGTPEVHYERVTRLAETAAA